MILLATDLDGTILGDDRVLGELLEKLSLLRSQNQLKLVYATGRSLESFRVAQSEADLPVADGLIVSVGTEIYIGENYQALAGWPQTFNASWDRAGIVTAAAKLKALTLQPASEQRPYKLSFRGNDVQSADLQAFQTSLAEIYSAAELLISHAGEFIDIVPRGSDKGRAVQYLAKHWQVPPENIICAGDSGNDIAMLRVAKAIVVGNAYAEVQDWFAAHPEQSAYFAKAKFAAGVSEGLDYFLDQN